MDEYDLAVAVESNTQEVLYEFSMIKQSSSSEVCLGSYDDGAKYLIRLCSNGKIIIRGEEVDDNKEVYEEFVRFLKGEISLNQCRMCLRPW